MDIAILRLFDRSAIVERDHAARIIRSWRRRGERIARSGFRHGGPMRAYTLPNGARIDIPQRLAHNDLVLALTDREMLHELGR